MTTILKFKRGQDVDANAFKGEVGELYVNLEKKRLLLHDGVTTGGFDVGASDSTIEERLTIIETACMDVQYITPTDAYTLALADRGKSIDTTSTVTIPLNSEVPFPIGTIITITNIGENTLSVVPITGVLLTLVGTTTVGIRTLAAYGMATIRKISADRWIISGGGIL